VSRTLWNLHCATALCSLTQHGESVAQAATAAVMLASVQEFTKPHARPARPALSRMHDPPIRQQRGTVYYDCKSPSEAGVAFEWELGLLHQLRGGTTIGSTSLPEDCPA
jgi:hypothetical protein